MHPPYKPPIRTDVLLGEVYADARKHFLMPKVIR